MNTEKNFQKLKTKYETAKRVHDELMKQAFGGGEVAEISLSFSGMLFHAQNDVAKAKRAITRAFNDGKITKEQYLQI